MLETGANDPNANDDYYDEAEDSCEFCKRKTNRFTLKDFCRFDYGKLF